MILFAKSRVLYVLTRTLMVLLVLSAVTFPFEFRRIYESSQVGPTQQYLNELSRIRDIFGYGNQSIVIFVRFGQLATDSRLAEWARAITGMPVYLGSSPYYYLANEVEIQLLDDPTYVGQTNQLRVYGLTGRPVVISDLLANPGPIDTLDAFPVSSGLYLLVLPPESATQRLNFVKEISSGTPLQLTYSSILIEDFNVSSWSLYLGTGGFNNATVSSDNGPVSVELSQGPYFVRVFHIFTPPINMSSFAMALVRVYSDTSKHVLLELSSQDNPLIQGGSTSQFAEFHFVLKNGWQYLVLPISSPTARSSELSISRVNQIIFYLDRDTVVNHVLLAGVYGIA